MNIVQQNMDYLCNVTSVTQKYGTLLKDYKLKYRAVGGDVHDAPFCNNLLIGM